MKVLCFGFLLFAVLCTKAQISPFEKSGGYETATYFEVINWYKALAIKSTLVSLKTMGPTDAGYPLHLVLLSKDLKFDPVKWHQQGKVVIMINNGIHPGEPDGIDASMMLARDIANKKIMLPDNVVIGIVPVYNIGGCLNRNSYTRANQNGPKEYGFRGNSQNLDLNRDFTKCDSKEAKSFTEIFHYLNPDILVDNHVSDGADFQHTMTLISTQYNKLGPVQGKWVREFFEPLLYQSMSKKGWDMIPYVDFGNTDFDKGMSMFMDPPRYSSGYAALFNTLSFMPETHMLKPYKERVTATYDLMVTFVRTASDNAKEIKEQRAMAFSRIIQQRDFALRWLPDSTVFSKINFSGYEQEFAPSEATGLQKIYYDHKKPFTKQIRFYHGFSPSAIVTAPKAYLIPQGWTEVINLLILNKVQLSRLIKDTNFFVNAYHIDEYKSYPQAYEKHHKNHSAKVSLGRKQVNFLKGDYVAYLNQPANRYLIEMLEPTAEDGFFAWNFFDGILQQKEGYSDYRWEDIAATVIKNDPSLKAKLESKKLSDPKFAADSRAILEYIYKNSPYYESAYKQYPIYRLEF